MKKNKFIVFFCILTIVCSCSIVAQKQTVGNFVNTDTVYGISTEALMSNKIPDSVFQIKNLRRLWIGGEDCEGRMHDDSKPNDGIKCWRILEVSPEIKNLKLLDTLGLTLALFHKLPDEISTLENLRYIDLTDDERIDSVDNLMPLTNLTELLLYGCGSLIKLPENIGNLKNLKHLGLVGTRIDDAELKRVRAALPNCRVDF